MNDTLFRMIAHTGCDYYSLGSCFLFLRFFLGASTSSLRRMHPKYTTTANPNALPAHKSIHNIRVLSIPLDEVSLSTDVVLFDKPLSTVVALCGKPWTTELNDTMNAYSTVHNIGESKSENAGRGSIYYTAIFYPTLIVDSHQVLQCELDANIAEVLV